MRFPILFALLLPACMDYGVKGDVDDLTDDTSPNDIGAETDTASPEQDSAPPDRDTASGQVTDSGQADTASDTADTGPSADTGALSILVYSTEDEAGAGSYAGIFDGLETDPQLSAWTVEVYERGSEGRLTAAMLEGRSQLWLLGTDRSFGSDLTSAEIEAVLTFVSAGGGLLIVAEHTDSLYSYTEDVNGVAEPLGLRFHDSYREGADGDLLEVEDGVPAITVGVSEVPGFASVAELSPTDSAVEVAFSLDGTPAMAWRTDRKRVVFDRSWGGWRDLFRDDGDQSVLVLNVATWLEGE